MTYASRPGPFRFRKAGSVRFAVAVCLFLLLCPVAVVRASALSEIEAGLPAGKTILTANAQNLAAAVSGAILSNTDPTITPAEIAAAAFLPMSVKASGTTTKLEVRTDRNNSAPLVAVAAIDALLSGSDATLAPDVAAITDSLVVVNGTNAKENLSTAGQAAVLKGALGTISDMAVTTSSASLMLVDQAIGQTLASDGLLESLPKNALTTLLQNALVGVNGVSGKSQGAAPEAAADFVNGLISSTVPNGASLPAFAVAILKDVSKNTSVDELVAYQVGFRDNVPADLTALAGALYAKYPAAAVKITQGIAAAVPQVGYDNDYPRAAFIQSLAEAQPAHVAAVAEGAVFVDPYFTGQFIQGVFTAVSSGSGGAKLLAANATGIASGVGAILGQDGDELTQVAEIYGQSIGSGALPAAKASAYATALIQGAAGSTIAPFTGAAAGSGGGNLAVKAGISAATVNDIASIEYLFAEGIITAAGKSIDNSPASINKAASEIGAMAGAIAGLTKNEAFVDTDDGGASVAVSVFLTSSLTDYIARLGLSSFFNGNTPVAPETILINAIEKSVEAATNHTVAAEITAAVNAVIADPASPQYMAVTGAISVEETAVTNL